MKILITGNMGYIGPCLTERLRKTRPEAFLAGLDTGYFAGCLTTPGMFPECRVDLQHFADIRNVKREVLEGVDAVIHLAALSNDPIGNSFEELTYDINYFATVALAKKAKAAGVRSFVYASSCSMYGSAEDGPRDERSPQNPLTAYAKSKVFSEKALEEFASADFTVTCLRFATACGMSDRLRLDLVLNDFVAASLVSGKLTILSDGTPWRPLIHIRDMAAAMDWAADRKAYDGGEFLAVNAGSDKWNFRIRDLAEAVAAEIPGVGISINKDAQPDRRSYRVSFGLFRKLAPEHQPKTDLSKAIRELKEGLEAVNFRDGNFRKSRLMRLVMLRQYREAGLLDEKLKWTGPIPALPGAAR